MTCVESAESVPDHRTKNDACGCQREGRRAKTHAQNAPPSSERGTVQLPARRRGIRRAGAASRERQAALRRDVLGRDSALRCDARGQHPALRCGARGGHAAVRRGARGRLPALRRGARGRHSALRYDARGRYPAPRRDGQGRHSALRRDARARHPALRPRTEAARSASPRRPALRRPRRRHARYLSTCPLDGPAASRTLDSPVPDPTPKSGRAARHAGEADAVRSGLARRTLRGNGGVDSLGITAAARARLGTLSRAAMPDSFWPRETAPGPAGAASSRHRCRSHRSTPDPSRDRVRRASALRARDARTACGRPRRPPRRRCRGAPY